MESGEKYSQVLKTRDFFLIYGGYDLKQEGYADSSFQSNLDDIKSVSRFVFTLNGGVVSRKSSKQLAVADSVTEAEYIVASEVAKERVWIKKFIIELGVVPEIVALTSLYCDNTKVVAQAKEPRSHHKSKHILGRYRLVREIIGIGGIGVKRVDMKTTSQIHSCSLYTAAV